MYPSSIATFHEVSREGVPIISTREVRPRHRCYAYTGAAAGRFLWGDVGAIAKILRYQIYRKRRKNRKSEGRFECGKKNTGAPYGSARASVGRAGGWRDAVRADGRTRVHMGRLGGSGSKKRGVG